MIDALEKISRESVAASAASHAYDYICPECKQPVILRDGYVRSAYFAHAPGVSNEDCALYAAAQLNSHGHAPNGNSLDAEEAQMRLCLKLARTNGVYAWGLELTIPTFGLAFGSLDIDVGGRVSKIRLEGNTSVIRAVTAEPQIAPYRVVETQPKYGTLAGMPKTCQGLNEHGATVFGDISRQNENPIPLAQTLKGDRTYAVLWNDATTPKFPTELSLELMASRQGWHGALLHIPHRPSDTSRNWLMEFTNLEFTDTTPAIVPVWPPLLRAITSRYMEARPSEAVAIFVEAGEHGDSAVTPPIFARSEKAERVAHANVSSPPFYQLSPQNSRSVHLACRKTIGLEMDIDFVLQEALIRERLRNAVMLKGIDKEGQQRNATLHSQDAMSWLNGVRNGSIQVTSIMMPIGISGEIRASRNQEWTTTLHISSEHAVRASTQANLTLTTKITQQIAALFRDDSLNILLDFSGFGRALIFARPDRTSRHTVALPAPILARIRNYFVRFPNVSAFGNGRRANSERELVEAIVRSRPTPQSLIIHRALIADIKKMQALLPD